MTTLTRAIFPCLILLFCAPALPAQAVFHQDTAFYPEVHSVEFEQVVYKTAPQIDELDFQINEDLALRVYYPTDLEPGERRPLVVLVHGGGFIGGSYTSFFDEAEALAQLGYVAASVQYRLCKRGDCVLAAGLAFPCSISWANSLVPSAYAAAVDAADAIRWLQLHANDYPLDPERVAVLGHSAGALTVLNVAFTDQEEITDSCPGCGTWPDYLAEDLETPTGIRAVINMSGAILDTLWMDETEKSIDLLSIHGTHDGVVFYGSDPVYPCCNSYNVPIYGSCPITHRQNRQGGNTYLFTGMNHGHDVFAGDWWPDNQGQILWFLGKSLFSDEPFQKHSEWVRPTAIPVCPPPLPAADAGALCELPLSDPGVVVFGQLPVSTIAVEEGAKLRLFPNPATGTVTISAEIPSKSIRIQSLYGQSLRTIPWQHNPQTIDLGDLPPGMYWLIAGNEVKPLIIH